MGEQVREAIEDALVFLDRIEGHGYGGEAEFENARRGLLIALENARQPARPAREGRG